MQSKLISVSGTSLVNFILLVTLIDFFYTVDELSREDSFENCILLFYNFCF